MAATYDIDQLLGDLDSWSLTSWFADNILHAAEAPNPPSQEEMNVAFVGQLATVGVNGFHAWVTSGADGAREIYGAHRAVKDIGFPYYEDALGQVCQTLDKYGLRDLVDQGGETFYALTPSSQSALEADLNEIDNRITNSDEWEGNEDSLRQRAVDYIWDRIDVFRQRRA